VSGEQIIKRFLQVEPHTTEYRERHEFIAAVSACLKAGDETFNRKTVEALLGQLTLAQEMLDRAISQDRWMQLSPEYTRSLAKFLERPNGAWHGPTPDISINAVGGGSIIRIYPKGTFQ
jgi:hypothetical protein